MKVVRAEAAGACYGVQRALDLAFKAAEDHTSVQSLGPLIHNPQVIDELRGMGVEVVDNPEDVTADAVIIRSHGVGPKERLAIESSESIIVDATCPYVLRAQKAGARLSHELGAVVVVGDPAHPEVNAIKAYALQEGGDVWVVDSPEALPANLPDVVGVVVQTTQNRHVLQQVLDELRARGCSVVLKDTICSATSERQDAARALAQAMDAMVVIGGHNSSNTTRLYEICKAVCPKTYHIECIEELDEEALRSCDVVGITAGASTPERQIAVIEAYLEGL